MTPENQDTYWAGTRLILALAASVVVIIGLRAGSSVVAPLLLAFVIAVAIAPAIRWLEGKGMRTSAALTTTVVVTVVVEIAIILLLSASLASFALDLPDYADQFADYWDSIVEWFGKVGLDLDALLSFKSIDPERLVRAGIRIIADLTNLFSGLLLVTLTVGFMLAEATTIDRKIASADMPASAVGRFQRLAVALRAFVKVTALLGAVAAIIETVLLLILGVPNAVLWGLLSFFFSFIPYVGFVIALIPPTLLALMTGGLVPAIVVVVGYLLINTASDNFVKPKVMGASTDLSPLAVFVSLVIWGWALGPLGGLLAVPMMLITKSLLLEAYPEWRWLAAVLGSVPKEEARPPGAPEPETREPGPDEPVAATKG